MATITLTVANLKVWSNGDSIRYRLTFKESFDGIQKVNDEYVETTVNYIDFVPRYLIAIALEHIPGVDVLYTKRKEEALRSDGVSAFGAAELQVILRGATIDVERNKFAAGDEYTTSDGEVLQHENAGYNTEVLSITVTDRVQDKLDAIADSVLAL